MSKKTAFEFKNLTKTQQNCLSLIESLGIYELRALARVFGDNSPTTLKRADHIEIVMNKIISGEDLKPIPLRQGRPYKELSNIEGILAELSQITGKDYTLKTNQQRSGIQPKTVVFRQAEQDILKKRLLPIEIKGVVLQNNDKDLYLINQFDGKNVLIKKETENRIKPFDYITGSAIIMNSEKDYILEKVSTINYQDIDLYKESKDEYVLTLPTKKLDSKFDIVLGKKYLIKGNLIDANIKPLLSKLKQENILTLALISNVMFEENYIYNQLDFNNLFVIKYEDNPFKYFETLTTFIGHIQKLQELGKNIAIFVQDITTIANSIDFVFKNNTKALMGHTEMAVEMIKKLVQLAKAGENEKHTTLFSTFDDCDLFDQMYISSVYKVSKKIEL